MVLTHFRGSHFYQWTPKGSFVAVVKWPDTDHVTDAKAQRAESRTVKTPGQLIVHPYNVVVVAICIPSIL